MPDINRTIIWSYFSLIRLHIALQFALIVFMTTVIFILCKKTMRALRQINKKQTWHLGGKESEKIDDEIAIAYITDLGRQRERMRGGKSIMIIQIETIEIKILDRMIRHRISTTQRLVVLVRLYVLTVRLQGARSLLDECRTNPVWLLKPCFTIQALQGWSLAISMRWHGLYLYIHIYIYIYLVIFIIILIYCWLILSSLSLIHLHVCVYT